MSCHCQGKDGPSPVKKSRGATHLNSRSNCVSQTRSPRHCSMGSLNSPPGFQTSSETQKRQSKNSPSTCRKYGDAGHLDQARRKYPSSTVGNRALGRWNPRTQSEIRPKTRVWLSILSPNTWETGTPGIPNLKYSGLGGEERLMDCILTAAFWFGF